MIRAVLACSALCLFLTACGGEKPEPQTPVDSGTHILPTQTCLDNDGDGVPGTGDCSGIVDCDDRNAQVFPGAAETCNNRDDNCDGSKDEGLTLITFYTDGDGDGFGAVASGQGCGEAPTGSVAKDGDCDDADASRHPTATETCNGIDDDCDGTVDNNVTFQDFYADADGDGFGDANGAPISACTATVQGRVTNHSDCDDTNPTVKPGASELCNRVDDNCDGQVDNGITYNDYYPDIDGDGFGDQYAAPESSCSTVAGKVIDHTDCDDARSTTKPNAPEQCNDIDDNCNGQVDEGLTFLTYYTDADGDGFGATTSSPQSSCAGIAGKVTNNTDCNDANPSVKPSATEVCNGIDDDCAGGVDNGLTVQQFFTDADGDGYGSGTASPSCLASRPGMVTNSTDCNDGNSAVHPGATEICNGVDDDCVGSVDNGLSTATYYPDGDGDGAGSNAAGVGITSCQAISGRVTNNTDCNDANAAIKPSAAEVCDNVDNNCSGSVDEGLATSTYYPDADHDNYGATSGGIMKCGAVGNAAGFVLDHTDCNDGNANIHPGATEICNSTDDNCNGTIDENTTPVNWYVDNDVDGYGAGTPISQCAPISGRVTNNADCNDNNAAIKPGASEICDGVDNNCNSQTDEGNPGGGAACTTGQPGVCSAGTKQCLNGNLNTCVATVTASAETCDGLDNNCDGTVDNLAATACNTGQAGVCAAGTMQCQGSPSTAACVRTTNPSAEVCDGLDNNCTGGVDENNPGGGAACTTGLQGVCSAGTKQCLSGSLSCVQNVQSSAEICDDLDNDCNGVIDNSFTTKGAACTSGVGACSRTGTNVCNTAHTGVVCNATPGSPEAPACDGRDNDCDGVTDEPVLNGTTTVSSAGYGDIEVEPFYYSSGSCQGGAVGSGTDALAGGAMMMAGPSVTGITFQRLNSDGTTNGGTVASVSLGYTDIDFAQAGNGWLVAGVWSYNNAEIDLYYLDVTGVELARKWTQFKISSTTTLDSLQMVRGNGRKATLIWRENGTGIKMAKIEACYDGTSWTIQQAGCASGTAALTSTTVAAVTTVAPGLGADSNAIDWLASQSCNATSALRTVGVAYRASTTELRHFTINDDGSGKSSERTFNLPSGGVAEAEPDIGFFKDASNVDTWLFSFVVQFNSSADVYFWRSNNPTTFDWAWNTSAATGANSITRTRVSAKSDGFQIAALRVFESEPTYPTQLMTRNYSLTGVANPAGTAVEIPAACNSSDSSCSAGNKSGLALRYPWSRVYYSAAASTSSSFDSVLTCN